ncbi:methanobactin export MATE transporter MbnM [Conexibacter sp. SYSU D00693]|uniref:methanobactin export MATE transporter MbnM n=1 Tax=Conexibacter sp. SYSU D00693 TaxID=2812560 RepID=UPI00196AD38E|nr:methanobactin export MATE transporter MbnM [Conexibacter sp. SYSU D00693]
MTRRRRGRAAVPVLASAALALVAWAVVADARPSAPWTWKLPKGFPTPKVPATNPMSKEKVELGRRLFHDTRLSGNGTQSCASCHRQELAFTDGRGQAVGSTGETHPRGAQSLVNVAYQQTLTWANPALTSLERQMEVPLFGRHPVEMGITDRNRGAVLKRLRRDPWYRARFPKAFPGSKQPLSYTTVIRSIAAFQRSIVSANSRLDRARRGELVMTGPERRGLALFNGERAECHHCHGSFIFNDQATYAGAPPARPLFHNNGLYNLGGTGAYPEPNTGIFEFTGRRTDMGRFKAPSLRNVGLTAPYMHDGSITTLREVVEHYRAGGRTIVDGPLAGDGRANPNKSPNVPGLALSDQDVTDLVAFLESLTDRSVTTNPRFSDPFRTRGR